MVNVVHPRLNSALKVTDVDVRVKYRLSRCVVPEAKTTWLVIRFSFRKLARDDVISAAEAFAGSLLCHLRFKDVRLSGKLWINS